MNGATSETMNIIITGASRGLGLEMVNQLSKHPPVKNLQIFACARNPPQPNPFDNDKNSNCSVKWHTLDVANNRDVQKLAQTLKWTCPNGIDVVINNAGINVDGSEGHNPASASKTLEVNLDGAVGMSCTFLPLMRRPGRQELGGKSRIVNVSSNGSHLKRIPSEKLREALREAKNLDDVNNLRNHYLLSVQKGTEDKEGWPKGISYSVSKALMNALTRVLAKDNRDLKVNCCCPGWCRTDTGGDMAAKSAEDGVKIPLKLAFGDIEESGEFWENPSVGDTADGQVAVW